MEKISTPELAEKSGYLLPNLSVIYGFGVLDLRQEVVVMTMPDSGGLYYMVETLDIWTANAFAYLRAWKPPTRLERSRPAQTLARTSSLQTPWHRCDCRSEIENGNSARQ